MRTSYYTAFILLVTHIGLAAQITLSTQAEVDAWDQSITELTGRIIISGSDITNIDAFSSVTSLTGELNILYNDALTNLDGLAGLTSIVGVLYIHSNDALTNLDDLAGLTSIEGTLDISFNIALTNLDGLAGLTSIAGTLSISDNSALTSLDGLSGLTSLEGQLIIENNNALTNIDGLSGIASIVNSGRLSIEGNDALTDVVGLSGLISIEGNLNIGALHFGNNALTNLDGLAGLTSIEGTLDITSNNALTNLDGLAGLTSIAGTIVIFDNNALTNLDGLASLTSIEGTLDISSNDALTNLDVLAGLTYVEGTLSIRYNRSLTNLDGLAGMTSMEGLLNIFNNDALINIDGLAGLTSIEGTLSISFNSALTNLDGLAGLTSIEGRFDITSNDALINIDGLAGLTSIQGVLYISHNVLLNDCCVLLSYENNPGIYIYQNASSCSSFQAIRDSDCGLEVAYEILAPCIGSDNGGIKLYASNYDTIPFNYTVTDLNQQQVATGTSYEDIICIDGLAEGTYSAYVSQPNGEEYTIDNIVLDPLASPSLDIIGVATTSSFNGLPNGSINLEYSGGVALYTISLSGPVSDQVNSGATSAQFDNLPAGDYLIILEDSEGSIKRIEVKLVDETLLVEECSDPMDIIVLNLVSSAISADEYGQSKPYFQTFFESINLGNGADDSQFAIAEWAGKNDQDLKIPITGDLSKLSLYQEHNRSYTGGTDPLFALKFGYDYLVANGRPHAQKVIIFTFDGCPGFSASAYAEELKELGVIIADIGIDYVWGSSRYQRILRQAASRDDLAYFARNFDGLDPLELYTDLTFANCSGISSNIYFDRDGSIAIDNVAAGNCPYPESVEVTFTVASLEQLSIPIGTTVSFYNNDPTQYGASLISTFLVPCPIPAGESETFTISLPIETATHLFAVLNDDGETSPSFTLPVTDIAESLYRNNIADERICVDGFATVQALKSSVSLYPICEDIVQYTIDVCNISLVDAQGVVIQDESPAGFSLVETIVNTNNCTIDNNGTYDIPAGCCVSLSLSYNIENAALGYYGDQDVFLSGPTGQTYLDFDGATTSAEDILLDGTEDCGTPVVTFQKEVNYATTCVDHSLTYTFTIENQSSTPIYGVQFTDVLPAPLEWVYKPYDKKGLSISMDDFLEGQTAAFTIDEIDAETIATFVIDVYVGYTDVEVTARNTARISGFPDYINNGVDFLESNTTTTTILGDIEIISIDTITVDATENVISLATQVTPVSSIEWTSSGDGSFSDNGIVDPTYTLGTEDRLDTLIGLFIGVDTHCGQKGKSVFIKRECSLEFDPVNVLEVCENQTLDAALSWSGGIGPYAIDELSDVIDMSTSVGLSELEAGTYKYTVNDAMGCESEVQLTISSISGPQTTYSATEEHCDKRDGSLTLDISSGIGPYTIEGSQTWTGIYDQLVISDLSGGDYSFTITDAQGCSSEEVLVVSAQPAPEVQETISQPDCDEMTGAVILEWAGATGDYSLAGDVTAQNISSPHNLDNLPIGSYQVTLIDTHGCTDGITFDIENPSPEASASATCIDSTLYAVQIATSNYDIVTDLGLAVSEIGQDAYEITNVPIDESIIITVTDPANGCDKVLTITPPDCSCSATAIVGDDQEITCYQETVILDASASSQGSDYSYAWYDSDGNLLSTENQYETDQEGTYTFEITDLTSACRSHDTIEVLPANAIETVTLSQSDILCHGESTGVIEIINVEGGTPDYSYYLNQQSIENLKIEELVSGDYHISIVDAADCEYDTLITLTEPLSLIAGSDLTELIVNLGRDIEVNIETNLPQEDIVSVIWTPRISCENCLAFTFEDVQVDLSYQITIIDNNNCEQTHELRILVDSDIAIYLPNVINPNADNNGVFFPQTSADSVVVKEMNIYDNWGNLVFSNTNFPVNDPAYGWDGSFNSGQAEIGEYVYTIVLENASETIQLSGDVTLLR